MELSDKQLMLLIISGASAFFAHEYAHQWRGDTAISEVTGILFVVGPAGFILNEFVMQDGDLGKIKKLFDKVPDEAWILSFLSGFSFAAVHEATHGELVLNTSLGQASYYLAGSAAVGFVLYEYAMDRIDE